METGGWEWPGNEVLEIRLSGLPGSEVRGMKLRIESPARNSLGMRLGLELYQPNTLNLRLKICGCPKEL